MHTMQVQPGRCRGCFVVVATDGVLGSLAPSPRIAALAKASRPEDSCPWFGLWLVTILLFLNSMKQ
jgi:hypothetical protein